MKAFKILFVLVLVFSGAGIWAQDCKSYIVLESVQYQGQLPGPGGQKVDQFAVRWGVHRACGSGGKANIVLKIKRLTQEETASANNIDSSRTSGNLINLTIPRGALQTDPKSWTVTITHTAVASSVRSVRISGQGPPNFSTATIGPIPGGPIAMNFHNPQVLQASGKIRKASVEPGVWRQKSAIAPDLLQIQVQHPSGTSGACFNGSITPIGLVHTPSNLPVQANDTVKVDWKAIAPSCEKIVSITTKAEFTRQDGTKIPGTTVNLIGTAISRTFVLPGSQSPIASYFIDLSFKTQLDDVNRGPFTLTKAGNF